MANRGLGLRGRLGGDTGGGGYDAGTFRIPGRGGGTYDTSTLSQSAQDYLKNYIKPDGTDEIRAGGTGDVDPAHPGAESTPSGTPIRTRRPERPEERRARLNRPLLSPMLPQDVMDPEERAALREQRLSAREQRLSAQEAGRYREPQITRAQRARNRFWAMQAGRVAQGYARTQVYLGQVPQPGGIGLVLFIILFIISAVQPMNTDGNTRIQLLWLGLMGKVKLPTSGSLDTTAGASGPTGSLQTRAAAALTGIGNSINSAANTLNAAGAGQAVGTAIVETATGGQFAPGANNSGLGGVGQGIGIAIGQDLSGLKSLLPYSSGG